jgi:hypothetical protein
MPEKKLSPLAKWIANGLIMEIQSLDIWWERTSTVVNSHDFNFIFAVSVDNAIIVELCLAKVGSTQLWNNCTEFRELAYQFN